MSVYRSYSYVRRLLLLAITACLLQATSLHALDIPAGTPLSVRLDRTVSSRTAQVGDRVACSLAEPLIVDGRELAGRGHNLLAEVTYVKRSGRFHKPGLITVRLRSIRIRGRYYRLHSSAIRDKGEGHTGSNITKIGGGAGIGALIGGIAGGGKGAGIGALLGAGGGTALAAATGRHPAEFRRESVHHFTLERSAR